MHATGSSELSLAPSERMVVTVTQRCAAPAATVARIRAAARRVLRALGESHAELTVSLVDDAEVQRLNRAYRGIDRPTDVLAFAMREGARAPGDESMLGDVVISFPTAASQARHRGVTTADELEVLLVHGILHQLGYDHERSAAKARRMRGIERQLHRALTRGSEGSLSLGGRVRVREMQCRQAGATQPSARPSPKGIGRRSSRPRG